MRNRTITTILLPIWLSLAFLTLPLIRANAGDRINQLHQRISGNLSETGVLPGTEGVAGAFAGLHNNMLIVAGGTAFPDGKPWEDGTKHYSDIILVYARNSDGTLRLEDSRSALPVKLGEGASVSTPGGLVCVGGQTPEGLSDRVYQIGWQNGSVSITELPPLPVPVKSPAAATIGNLIYVIGGETAEGPSARFLVLNLTEPNSGWRSLPDFPLPVHGAMAAAQMDGEEVSLHVIGGRARMDGQKTTSFYPHVFRFRPSRGEWEKRQDIRIVPGNPFPVAAGAAVAIGASHVVLIGGDNGAVFSQVEKAISRLQNGETDARQIRDSLWINHPGFNQKILIYNTVTDTWFDEGNWDGDPVAVMPAVQWGGAVIVPGGEIRPGIRTPEIREITFSVKPVFGWLNYLVLIVYFAGMLMLGFFFMKKEGDTEDFFKAGGRIPWWAAGISIFATTLSAITFIAIPAKSYAADWRMFTFNMTIILIAPIVIRYFLPFFRRFNFDTAYQYLDARFNRSVRWLASALFVFFMVSRISIVLFLPSLALNAVTGFSVYWAIVIMGVVTIIYCTSGGIEAVVWGDVIQGFILLAGAFTALVFMLTGVEGGLGGFLDITAQHNKFHTFDFRFNFSQPVFWVVLLGGLANTLISYTSDQSVVQRYMTTKDEKATGRSIWLNGILSIPVTIVFFMLGTGLYAYYTSNPERMAVVNPNIDSVFPQFIVAQMPAGVAGLLIAAIFAAAMSTLSSNINSVAAVITSDFYKTISRKPKPAAAMRIARWSGIIVGMFGIAMAIILATWNIASLWDQFNSFLGLLTGGLGALFIMGIFFRRISGPAALIGTIAGMAVLLMVKNHTVLSFLMYGFTGITASVILALLVSLFLPNRKNIDGYTWRSQRQKS
ncbi:MAG: sodium:solute symporter family transporter [Bacteroidota bacterium]